LPGIEAEGEPGERLRHEAGETLDAGEFRLEFENEGAVLGLQYADSPCIETEKPVQPQDPNHYTPFCAAGCRAPHAEIGDGRSTLDLYGRGFCLLRLGPDAPIAADAERATQTLGVPFEVQSLVAPAIHALHGRALVLVRPDGVVAWRGDQLPEDLEGWIDFVRGA